MTYYVMDTTVNPPREARFGTFPDTVKYLEGMSVRKFKQSRKDRMLMLEEIGHGYDDSSSVNFVRSMADVFEMGVIRNNAGALNRMRCDIVNISLFQKEEFGS